MKKLKVILFVGLWMFFSTFYLFSVALIGYAHTHKKTVFTFFDLGQGSRHLSLPWTRQVTVPSEVTVQKEVADARVTLVNNFLKRHSSPILAEDPDFARFLVALADEQALDFRLLPAIAMQESNLCKVVPPDSHNCLGLGVHSRGTWGFATYRDNFTAAAKILKKNYIEIGLTTPELIETKYNPTSANRDSSWARSVNQWMAEMRFDDRELGREKKSDADLLEFVAPKQ